MGQSFTEDQQAFKAKWQPSPQCEEYLDEQGRNLSRPLADNVVSRIRNQPATVLKLEKEKKRQTAPLPYNLSALQIDCNKAFGLSAQKVLDSCQQLYERHKLITYPRSDCRYLPEAHFYEAGSVVEAVSRNLPDYAAVKSRDDFAITRKSRAWNDAKVGAHHGIIPTQKTTSSLGGDELRVYQLICRQYLAQFFGPNEFEKVKVTVDIAGGHFIARDKVEFKPGWKQLFPSKQKEEEEGEPLQKLPSLHEGQSLTSAEPDILEKTTSPPKHYTEASLLAAMTGIARHVKDAELKKVLRETDGLGTEATRAGIIELLFKRGFLERKGKTVLATAPGLAFIQALPEEMTLPDMTALWESELAAISDGGRKYQDLMNPLVDKLGDMVTHSRSILPKGLSGMGKPTYKKRKRKKAATKHPSNK